MTDLKLIVSDLHLADGHPVLDGFSAATQAALAGLLLHATSSESGNLGHIRRVELIINGDCFDFLVIPPYEPAGRSDTAMALSKLEKIITAHHPFFEMLRDFVAAPGHMVTFIIGNHDIELCFEPVRTRILQTIGADAAGVQFCLTRSYRPLPDVHVEHGNRADFWNDCDIWDEQGAMIQTPIQGTITLPIGALYFQHAAYPLSLQYPYFDHCEPSVNTPRQIALLSLFNPELVAETARRLMELLSYPRQALAHLAPGEEAMPATFFEQVILDFAAFQQDMRAQKSSWVDPSAHNASEALADAVHEVLALREALTLPLMQAVSLICVPTVYQMGESVTRGMEQVLQGNPQLRYAVAGHTHMSRLDPINNASQVYINTGSWTRRLALPAPGEITPALIEWLRRPDWSAIPLRDVTQLTFAMVTAESDETGHITSPSNATLCVWEGGAKGTYRVLA